MNWNDHSKLEGLHAFLGASSCSWLNYSEEQLEKRYHSAMAKTIGTRLHEFAKEAIELGIQLKRCNKTLNMHVNDAISYRMTPEVVLYYSENCFGTADAISFSPKTKMLRIHDLKTGATSVHMGQLEIYAALFCLEYGHDPSSISIELRIYQNNDCQKHVPEPQVIKDIMDKIIYFDKLIDQIKNESRTYRRKVTTHD